MGSFNRSWQLFLGPWQARSVVLGSRHLLESRRPWGVGEAEHRVWPACIWPWGRGMCVTETERNQLAGVTAVEVAEQGLTLDF